MQRTLQEHITYLELKIEALKKELQEPEKPLSVQAEIQIDLGIAERSLTHFKKAFELEQRVSRSVSRYGGKPN